MLELSHLTKRYHPNHPPVVDDLSLTIVSGEMLALLGPSGCGKTTTLRIIAGLEGADGGTLSLDGQTWMNQNTFLEPSRRGVGMVFQDYALFPHLNVLQNVLFGLHGRPQKEALEQAQHILNLVGLSVFTRRFPHELSGGQQQRVSLARALAPQPRLMLLDEPFSNLDAALRSSTRAEVRSILKGTGVTTVLVTHDQEEALSFADRIALMRAGRLEQVGTPREVYAAPRTVFCASFLGRTNLMQGQAQGLSATTALGTLELSEPAQGLVMLSLRPEQLELGDSGVVVVVQDMEYLGTHTQYTCTLGNMRLEVRDTAGCPLERGDYTRVRVNGVARVMHG